MVSTLHTVTGPALSQKNKKGLLLPETPSPHPAAASRGEQGYRDACKPRAAPGLGRTCHGKEDLAWKRFGRLLASVLGDVWVVLSLQGAATRMKAVRAWQQPSCAGFG